jgi:hypothetical protein
MVLSAILSGARYCLPNDPRGGCDLSHWALFFNAHPFHLCPLLQRWSKFTDKLGEIERVTEVALD